MIEHRRVYCQSAAVGKQHSSVAAAVQPAQRAVSGFGVAGLEAEEILSRTVAVAAGENCSPALEAASEFERRLVETVVAVVGAAAFELALELELVEEIAALELVEVFASVSAVDSRLESETELVELCNEHPAAVDPVDAGNRHSEIPWSYWVKTVKAIEPGTLLPAETD